MSGYLAGLLAMLSINIIVAYSVFVPGSAGLLNLGAAGFVLEPDPLLAQWVQQVDDIEVQMQAQDGEWAALTPDADIKGTVAAQVNTIQAGFVAESGATLTEFATGEETIAAVRDGQAEAVFADKDFLAPYVKESNGELVWVKGQDKVVVGEGIAIGLRQSDTELKAKFDAAIKSMKDDGSLNTMIKKWFGDEAMVF